MKKHKVLMIGPARSVHGGISGVVNNYYEAGLDKQIELCYIGTMEEGSKLRKLLRAAFAYLQFLSQLPHYDIVHVNVASDRSYIRKSLFIKAAKRAGKKIVIHQHGGDFEGYYGSLGEKKKESVRKVLAMGDVFLVLAPAWKEFFGRLIGEERIIVFPDCIAIPPKTDKQYGQGKLLFLGRLCKEKGIGELLSVMPELQKKYPGIHLYLGGIFEEKELEKQALAMKDSVTFLSWVTGEQKKRHLAECDIFVLPSYFEGQSVAILEAMAYSCAVVASDTGGIPQMILEGKTGTLVRPKDAASLQEGLERVLADAAYAKKLGSGARAKAEAEFSLEKNIERLLNIYEGL